MEPGCIIEYIEQKKIICAVVLEVKNQKLRLFTENSREIVLSPNRIIHATPKIADMSLGRNTFLTILKDCVKKRIQLMQEIDIKEIWEVVKTEQTWIDLQTMTELCFPNGISFNHESAMIRAVFENRMYFKFENRSFYPFSEKQVESELAKVREVEKRNRLIENGAMLLESFLNGKQFEKSSDHNEIISILSEYYIRGEKSNDYELAKAILKKAGGDVDSTIFKFMVLIGIWAEDENIDLFRHDVPIQFSESIMERTRQLTRGSAKLSLNSGRQDLTELYLITIDGQSTLDYDDALSLEKTSTGYTLGVHIIDVGHYIQKGDVIDRSAIERGSTIYMPDSKIPMLPQELSENLCSLKAGELRPGISVMINLDSNYSIKNSSIFASQIRVKSQLTYSEVNKMVETDPIISAYYEIGKAFRQKRLSSGAIQIILPEINIWFEDDGRIAISRVDRETPARMFVSEIMIMANWLMAQFISDNQLPAIFRSQPEPKVRLYRGEEGSLFQQLMQRKHLSRVVLNTLPDYHSGLGLHAYVTSTSPIRKYVDLATQRQLRAILGLEEPYSSEQVKQIFQLLEQPLSYVNKIQTMRRRYWILKYLETKTGIKEEALVLEKYKTHYQILLSSYMLECKLTVSNRIELKPQDIIQVVIQHANARNDQLSIYVG
ncbi:MAG: RNB domain-containing ribonuclease [Desulfobacterales bacterium]|nr:RNB domain-containing ribonuclease [Desulfobacterales bacterium]